MIGIDYNLIIMKQLFIAGNWKSNKGIVEAQEWLRQFNVKASNYKLEKSIQIVLCVPFTLLQCLNQKVIELSIPLELGAQDISPFGAGAYTGEVYAAQIKELATWVIIGHSERRKYFSETDELLQKKVEQAKSVGLKIIYCVPDDKTSIPSEIDVVAYEPVWAIGTGKTDSPTNANTIIQTIKTTSKIKTVIYGGSVTAQNVGSFVQEEAIDGVLPGGASLDAQNFSTLIANTSLHTQYHAS